MRYPSLLVPLGAFLFASHSMVCAVLNSKTSAGRMIADEGIAQIHARDDDVKHAVFQQLIDHDRPEKGTFSQSYYYNVAHYGGPGSPVILSSSGESPASSNMGVLANRTLQGHFMESNGAAGILLEHRYYGDSSPYEELTVENLQELTVKNAIYDLTYFAQNVRLPFDPDGQSSPAKAPWVLTGCSYSGGLSSWTYNVAPGTFWAYHSSSGAVEAVRDFWQYNDIVAQAMPKNCSRDMTKAIRYIDSVLDLHDEEASLALKTKFNLQELKNDTDFVGALAMFPPWQNVGFASGYSPFFQFCDYIENQWPGSSLPIPGEEGVGETKAVEGFAKWTRDLFRDYACGGYSYWPEGSVQCFDTHNISNPMFTDTSVDNPASRQYNWLLCNEPLEWWQVSRKGHDGIISQYVTPEFTSEICERFFPSHGTNYTYGLNKGWTSDVPNNYTGGWNIANTTRFLWVNGELDPWLPTTVSSDLRPGGPLQSSEQVPVFIVPGGSHCPDISAAGAAANEEAGKIFDEEVQIIKKWVNEFYEEKDIQRPSIE